MKKYLGLGLVCIFCFAGIVNAEIHNWQTGQVIRGTENITPEPGINLSGWSLYPLRSLRYADLADSDLTSAAFSGSELKYALFTNSNLNNSNFESSQLLFVDFTNANLTNANLHFAFVPGAIFNDSIVNGVDLHATTSRGFTSNQLYSTKSYKDKDLSGIRLSGNNLKGWDFSEQNLTNSNFSYSDLTGANLTNAIFTNAQIQSVNFQNATSFGFTAEQFYSTKSYKDRDLSGIWQNQTSCNFSNNNLSGWNFTGQELINVKFSNCNLTNTNFTLADLRGTGLYANELSASISRNTIMSSGVVNGLNLINGDVLNISNDYSDVKIYDKMVVNEGGSLRFIFDDRMWMATVSMWPYEPTVEIGGTLDLAFADGVDIASLIGTSFKIFEWNGLLADGDMFDSIVYANGTQWDVSGLYTTGEVVLTAVPEPMTIAMFCLGWLMIGRKRKNFNQNKEILRKI
jgi:uncharacterized protein YjbI with pentapeptide repeats